MGLFDAILSRKESALGSMDAEAVLKTEALAQGLSASLGEEFKPGKVGKSAGHMSKSSVIGISSGEAFALENMVEVGKDDLKIVGEKVIMLEKHHIGSHYESSSVDLKTFQRIITYLDAHSIIYHILINRDKITPMVIRTEKGDITIAPQISTL
jgi:hypothetical protein